jgi:hypothetical protein
MYNQKQQQVEKPTPWLAIMIILFIAVPSFLHRERLVDAVGEKYFEVPAPKRPTIKEEVINKFWQPKPVQAKQNQETASND